MSLYIGQIFQIYAHVPIPNHLVIKKKIINIDVLRRAALIKVFQGSDS